MLKIDKELCIACGLCEETCAFGAIEVVDSIAVVNDKCTLCGSCVEVCEVAALSITGQTKISEINLSEWSGVWIYAEFRHGMIAPVSFELLGIGRQLADQRGVELVAVLLGHECSAGAKDLIAHGADKVYLVDEPQLQNFTDETHGDILADLLKEHQPEIVLAGATAIGRSFIPRVATMLGAGLTADCTNLTIGEDGSLQQTRPAFGGNIMATIVCPHTRPQMSTVRPLVMQALEADHERSGEIIQVKPKSDSLHSLVTVLTSVLEGEDQVKLNEAEIVVAGGRGLDNKKGFTMVKELADLLGGAVAASRAAVDSGWVSYQHQVGQTGKTVAPKLYICCGISGAIQHVVGMQSAETIIAINNDPNAPIFDVATYGIVADVYEILPKLIEKLREKRG